MSTLERLLAEDTFEDETFDALRAGEIELSGKELYRCTFRNAKLNETDWKRTRLEDCAFESCDLTRAKVAQLSLRSVS
ncbi:MAG TPA: pentapeptide repeat-containing protein, partial [Polyangiales bacterium]